MKIDNPQKGSYFAAQTAAPVTRSMLEQALAARTVALDRARLSNVAPTAERAPLEEPDGPRPLRGQRAVRTRQHPRPAGGAPSPTSPAAACGRRRARCTAAGSAWS